MHNHCIPMDAPIPSHPIPSRPIPPTPHRQYSPSPLTHAVLAFEFAGGWKDIKGATAVTVLQYLLGGGGSFSAGGPGMWKYKGRWCDLYAVVDVCSGRCMHYCCAVVMCCIGVYLLCFGVYLCNPIAPHPPHIPPLITTQHRQGHALSPLHTCAQSPHMGAKLQCHQQPV